ncbi:UNVERIFIED_CONTAM: hypothetical protein ABIC26_002052 [Paenibacillus sp. PvR008]
MWRDAQHAWNPNQKEIKLWAYSDMKIPDQDWELAVNSFENIPMICSFVDDEKCKPIHFFLSSLYVFTGDVVKSGEEEVIKELALLLEKVSNFAKTEQLNAWIERSKHLIQHPRDYNYDYWGLGSQYVDKYLY